MEYLKSLSHKIDSDLPFTSHNFYISLKSMRFFVIFFLFLENASVRAESTSSTSTTEQTTLASALSSSTSISESTTETVHVTAQISEGRKTTKGDFLDRQSIKITIVNLSGPRSRRKSA